MENNNQFLWRDENFKNISFQNSSLKKVWIFLSRREWGKWFLSCARCLNPAKVSIEVTLFLNYCSFSSINNQFFSFWKFQPIRNKILFSDWLEQIVKSKLWNSISVSFFWLAEIFTNKKARLFFVVSIIWLKTEIISSDSWEI